ncbi:hypothetical protein [Bacillus sp. 165]|uniref:hypothetical protein n=1 Tax=Bacillus sp. 165 TaxID=1529117 RepID=UPI001ADACFFF|nr:hypothetical protein [Bacillus sp. 165]MBO9130422.1 hypothetical protein [Bacillus sp. 165]
MKAFSVCYTFESNIQWEQMTTELGTSVEEVTDEVLNRLEGSRFVTLQGDAGTCIINAALVRQVRVVDLEN